MRLNGPDHQRAAWVTSCVKSCSPFNKKQWRNFKPHIWYLNCHLHAVIHATVVRNCSNKKNKHLLWAYLINHTNPFDLHTFLYISVIITRNFDGRNPDGSLAIQTTGLTHAKLVSLTSLCSSGWPAQMNTPQGQQLELSWLQCLIRKWSYVNHQFQFNTQIAYEPLCMAHDLYYLLLFNYWHWHKI